MDDILKRIEDTNHIDDSWMDLRCRLTDCADEIICLRTMVESQQETIDILLKDISEAMKGK